MSAIKDISENEHQRMSSGVHDELHLWREGTFLRAYEWSAWLACRYLHEFKVNRRAFKGVDSPVVYICTKRTVPSVHASVQRCRKLDFKRYSDKR